MADRTSEALLSEVLAEYQRIEEPRIKRILESVIRHVHACARDMDLSHDEWLKGIDFLTRVGQICSGERQEFILLSDLLGLSALVELQDRNPEGEETPGSVAGPFHVTGSPFIPIGGSINLDHVTGGQTAYVHGQVRDVDGTPLGGAVLDLWQTAPNSLYAVQDKAQSEFNLRGKQVTDAHGNYGFYTAKPVPYTVPRDGPCGFILDASNRHGMRAAHIHVGIEVEGYKPLTTEIFPSDDPYLNNDTVFGACDNLLVEYVENTSPDIEADLVAKFDFVLRRPSGATKTPSE